MTLSITPAQFQHMGELLAKKPQDILHSWVCRQYLAKTRWESSDRVLKIHGEQSEGVMPGTIRHNSTEVADNVFGSATRSQRLLGPLSGLDPVYSGADRLRVLSIGPRTEIELFHLMALGFRPENISALDLISSSPLIRTGDMHAMPYPDNHFDVVISSWVLNYSSTPQTAVNEMVRVAKPNALVAIGLTYAPQSEQPDQTIIGSMQFHSDNIAYLLTTAGGNPRICFQESPPNEKHKAPVMLIARIK